MNEYLMTGAFIISVCARRLFIDSLDLVLHVCVAAWWQKTFCRITSALPECVYFYYQCVYFLFSTPAGRMAVWCTREWAVIISREVSCYFAVLFSFQLPWMLCAVHLARRELIFSVLFLKCCARWWETHEWIFNQLWKLALRLYAYARWINNCVAVFIMPFCIVGWCWWSVLCSVHHRLSINKTGK